MSNVRARLLISGVVQGVFFRANTQREALDLGLTGWVRNLPDGRVEALAEGARETVEKLVEYCHRGPRWSRVDNVEVEWSEATGEFQDFLVSY